LYMPCRASSAPLSDMRCEFGRDDTRYRNPNSITNRQLTLRRSRYSSYPYLLDGTSAFAVSYQRRRCYTHFGPKLGLENSCHKGLSLLPSPIRVHSSFDRRLLVLNVRQEGASRTGVSHQVLEPAVLETKTTGLLLKTDPGCCRYYHMIQNISLVAHPSTQYHVRREKQ
jgi:hypothetical protein